MTNKEVFSTRIRNFPYGIRVNEDLERCKIIVVKLIEEYNLVLNNEVANKILEDVMNISYSKGGDYSKDNISAVAEVYFESDLYKKYM